MGITTPVTPTTWLLRTAKWITQKCPKMLPDPSQEVKWSKPSSLSVKTSLISNTSKQNLKLKNVNVINSMIFYFQNLIIISSSRIDSCHQKIKIFLDFLYSWWQDVNKAAYELCCQNSGWLLRKALLNTRAQEVVRLRYRFAHGSSRSGATASGSHQVTAARKNRLLDVKSEIKVLVQKMDEVKANITKYRTSGDDEARLRQEVKTISVYRKSSEICPQF